MKKVLFLSAFLLILFEFNSMAADDIINVGLYYGNSVVQRADLSCDEGLISPDCEELTAEITAKFKTSNKKSKMFDLK